eukprot:2189241-Prymnesium_polylepis.3
MERRCAVLAKLKVAMVFFQNVLSIPVVYGVAMPRDWTHWISPPFSWLELNMFDIFHADCVDSVSTQLNLALMVLGALHAAFLNVTGVNAWGSDFKRQMLMTGTPWALFVIFALAPAVSRTPFAAGRARSTTFQTKSDESVEFLAMRTTVVCGSDEHQSITDLASAYVALWPVAAPLLCLLCLLSSRKAILTGVGTDWSRAT